MLPVVHIVQFKKDTYKILLKNMIFKSSQTVIIIFFQVTFSFNYKKKLEIHSTEILSE